MNRRLVWLAGVIYLVALLGACDASEGADVTFERIGNPTWLLTDGHVYTAPNPSSLPEFQEFTLAILPLHEGHPQLGAGPGTTPHANFETEMGEGLMREGLVDRRVFVPSEFGEGNAIWASWMAVPGEGAESGDWPEGGTGPIIPNAILPISAGGLTTRNGELFDPDWAPSVSAPPTLDPPLPGSGYSHFPLWTTNALEFGPPGTSAEGEYVMQLDFLDVTGAGYRVTTRWTVQ